MNEHRVRRVVTIDPDEPKSALGFTLILAVVALCITVLSIRDLPSGVFTWVAIPFAVIVGMAESMPVALPRGEQRVSVSFSVVYAVIILFEPFVAASIIGLGVVAANLFQRKKLNIWLFNGAQIFIISFITSSLWQSLNPGVTNLTFTEDVPLMFLVGVAFFTLNIVLTTISVSLAHRLRPQDVLADNVKWILPNVLVLWILGLLIIMVYQSNAGILGVLLLWMPLLVMRYSFQQYMDLKHAHVETIQSLAAALDAKDPYTHGHSKRVADLATRIARHMNLREADIEAIHYAGILHDIGKIAVNDEILNKKGLLTVDELLAIRSHPQIGADIVKHVGFLEGIADMIKHHHEFFDGSGYPTGLKGEEIPLGARILCVADAFDAMTIDRVYRKGRTRAEAVEQLVLGKGTQFDPEIVDLFIEEVLPELTEESRQLKHQLEVTVS